MHTPAPIILRLEIDRAGERISGRLAHTTRPAVPFSGWLELAAAIEQATRLGGAPSSATDLDDAKR